jgi:hypothetical protein
MSDIEKIKKLQTELEPAHTNNQYLSAQITELQQDEVQVSKYEIRASQLLLFFVFVRI